MEKILVISNNISVKLSVFIDKNYLDFVDIDNIEKVDISNNYNHLLYIHSFNLDRPVNLVFIQNLKKICEINKINHIILCLTPKFISCHIDQINSWNIKKTIIYQPFIWDYFYEYNIINLKGDKLETPTNIDSYNIIGLSSQDFYITISNIILNQQYHESTYKLGEYFVVDKLSSFNKLRKCLPVKSILDIYHISDSKEDFLFETRKIHNKVDNIISWFNKNNYNFLY